MCEAGSKDCPWCKVGEVFLAYVFHVDEAYELGYETVRVDLEHTPVDTEAQYYVFVSEKEWREKKQK